MTAGHDELIDLLGVYALDAVTPAERRTLEDHLAVCASCRAEVQEHLEVAGALSARGVTAPPPELWARITARIDGSAPASGGRAATAAPALRLVGPTGAPGPHASAIPDGPVELVELVELAGPVGHGEGDPRGPGRSPTDDHAAGVSTGPVRPAWSPPTGEHRDHRVRRLVLGAMAVAAATIVVLVAVALTRSARQGDDLAADRAPIAVAADRAATDPTATQVVLRRADGSAAASGVVTAGGEGYLVADGLTPLPDGRTYQLWQLGPGGPVSLGVLGPGPGTVAFHLEGVAPALALTDEPAGGRPAPSGTPLATSTA